mmetsp:Transcript_64999/g.121052  ORF Transcript_64999/g.121052 Transcript_64999/m.121052 type:complete len:166 (-) Transcript_64999:10-507(-)
MSISADAERLHIIGAGHAKVGSGKSQTRLRPLADGAQSPAWIAFVVQRSWLVPAAAAMKAQTWIGSHLHCRVLRKRDAHAEGGTSAGTGVAVFVVKTHVCLASSAVASRLPSKEGIRSQTVMSGAGFAGLSLCEQRRQYSSSAGMCCTSTVQRHLCGKAIQADGG